MTTPIDIERIIAQRRVRTLFQPLVSARRKSVIALEALSRGLDPESGAVIAPNALFAAAKDRQTLVALDRLCRERAVEAFVPLYRENKGLMLSINIDTVVIRPETVNSNHLFDLVKNHGIHPNNVIIEFVESKAADTDCLLQYVRRYASAGFLIALDDVGAAHSNLDRILMLKPHILKLDRSLIADIHLSHNKREIVRSLARLGHGIGAMVLAEGVESIEEALCCLERGVEMFQGYYFARPAEPSPILPDLGGRMESLAARFKAHTIAAISRRKDQSAGHRKIVRTIAEALALLKPEAFELALTGFLDVAPDLECLYILNRRGIQITETICNPHRLQEACRFLFEPATAGADHSMKNYYLPLKAGLRIFTTEPYISLASGSKCITLSIRFKDAQGHQCILCVDLSATLPGMGEAEGLPCPCPAAH